MNLSRYAPRSIMFRLAAEGGTFINQPEIPPRHPLGSGCVFAWWGGGGVSITFSSWNLVPTRFSGLIWGRVRVKVRRPIK